MVDIIKAVPSKSKQIEVTNEELNDWEEWFKNKWSVCVSDPTNHTVVYTMEDRQTVFCFKLTDNQIPFADGFVDPTHPGTNDLPF